MILLLDTHVLWRWVTGERKLSRPQARALAKLGDTGPALVSDITVWELAMLYSDGRIRLTIPLREWLEKATAPPLVERCGITPAIAAELVTLPTWLHRDPVDRILIATARVRGATLVTSDERIIQSKLVPTLA